MVTRISNWSCEQLEESLLPVKGNGIQKIATYAYHFFKFLVMLPIAATTSLLSFLVNLCSKKPVDSPLVDFAKHPKWSDPVHAAPVDIGFASADFQENGPKIHSETNWGKFYEKNGNAVGQFPDIWNHPERLIDRLNDLGVKKYRFSVSRDKLEPVLGGPLDPLAVQHYRNFIRQLRQNGIEPMATLSHFSDPTYFSWDRAEDVAGFVNFSAAVSEVLHEEGVRKIITINEPTVEAFQRKVMGEFPPNDKLDFEGAGRILENMMNAHTQVYNRLKAAHPDFEIGFSHDPIRFRHYHKVNPLWTPIEKIICHYLSELNHGALMRYMQTGKFNLKVPFGTNYEFGNGTPPPLDFIGVQYYTDPLLKISFTGGGSVTRNPEEKKTSYDYRLYPQGLASVLDEFRTLKNPQGEPIPIDLTEIGIDIGVNTDATDKERIAYYDKVFQVVGKALENGVNVRSLHFWTLIDSAEWYKVWKVRFGFCDFNPETGVVTERPAYRWIKDKVAARNGAAAAAI